MLNTKDARALAAVLARTKQTIIETHKICPLPETTAALAGWKLTVSNIIYAMDMEITGQEFGYLCGLFTKSPEEFDDFETARRVYAGEDY